jgi:hypothetical protein
METKLQGNVQKTRTTSGHGEQDVSAFALTIERHSPAPTKPASMKIFHVIG